MMWLLRSDDYAEFATQALKDVVNDVLRRGLSDLTSRAKRREPFQSAKSAKPDNREPSTVHGVVLQKFF
jgi:hypothetical protein